MTTFSDRVAINWRLYLILLRRSIREFVKTFGLREPLNGKRSTMQTDESSQMNFSESSSQKQENTSDLPLGNSPQTEEILRISLYEEVPDIQSEVVVREQVQVRKMIVQQSKNFIQHSQDSMQQAENS
jgi:Domain of unknown function (DUF2382)